MSLSDDVVFSTVVVAASLLDNTSVLIKFYSYWILWAVLKHCAIVRLVNQSTARLDAFISNVLHKASFIELLWTLSSTVYTWAG